MYRYRDSSQTGSIKPETTEEIPFTSFTPDFSLLLTAVILRFLSCNASIEIKSYCSDCVASGFSEFQPLLTSVRHVFSEFLILPQVLTRTDHILWITESSHIPINRGQYSQSLVDIFLHIACQSCLSMRNEHDGSQEYH